MTLLEVMTALAILGLTAAFAFTQIGGWLGAARATSVQAKSWRDAPALQVFVQELAAGVIDPAQMHMDGAEARFRVLLPRLSPRPFQARLHVEAEEEHFRLLFSSPQNPDSLVFETATPMRLSAQTESALVVEIETPNGWTPIAMAPLGANAPLVCAFDPISRGCR